MKNNIFVKLLLLAVMGLIGECAFAQGLLVLKKDGSEIRIPQSELNYVTVFEKEDSSLPMKMEKRLKSVTTSQMEEDSWGNPYEYVLGVTYVYDKDQRVVSRTDIEKESTNTYTDEYKYYWNGNKVSEKHREYQYQTDFFIENGKVNTSVDEYATTTYIYDAENQPIRVYDDVKNESRDAKFVWKNGRVVSATEQVTGYPTTTYQIEYGNQKTKGFFPGIIDLFAWDNEFFMAHPEFLGKLMTELPTKVIQESKEEKDETTFTYEFDAQGYVTKCVMTGTNTYMEAGKQYTETYKITDTYVWE